MAQEPHEDPRQHIRQYKRTCLPSLTKTPGDHFDEHVAQAFRSVSEPLGKAGVSPVILWGDLSNSYYGIPTAEITFQFLVPKGCLDTAHATLEASGFLVQPLGDRYRGWEAFGGGARLFITGPTTRPLFSAGKLPHTILLHDFEVGHSIFAMDDLSSYPQFGGISIPPLIILAQSYVRSAAGIVSEDILVLMLQSLVHTWFMYVRDLGYSPLGIDAREHAAYLDNSMKRWWKGK